MEISDFIYINVTQNKSYERIQAEKIWNFFSLRILFYIYYYCFGILDVNLFLKDFIAHFSKRVMKCFEIAIYN